MRTVRIVRMKKKQRHFPPSDPLLSHKRSQLIIHYINEIWPSFYIISSTHTHILQCVLMDDEIWVEKNNQWMWNKKVFRTCFPLINQVMCGAGCAFDVVQLDTKFSPIVNWRLLNVILGGPVCWTAGDGQKMDFDYFSFSLLAANDF